MENILSGTIVKISGPVVDVRFPAGKEPPINALLKVDEAEKYAEVAAHEGGGVVRSIALDATEGLYCGMTVSTDGGGIRV